MSVQQTPQERFDAQYIGTLEIQQSLRVNRSAILHARQRGLLPDPITVPGVRAFIWERASVTPYLEAWKLQLAARRGELK